MLALPLHLEAGHFLYFHDRTLKNEFAAGDRDGRTGSIT